MGPPWPPPAVGIPLHEAYGGRRVFGSPLAAPLSGFRYLRLLGGVACLGPLWPPRCKDSVT